MSLFTDGRGYGSEIMTSLICCSTNRATAIFSLVPVVMHVYCRPAAKDGLGQAKGAIILALSFQKLEQHGMEAKFPCS